MSAVTRLDKSRNRMLTDLPYVAPPGATPEGKQAVYKLRITPMQPSEGFDSCIQHLVKGNPKRFDRSKTRSRLHNKEYLIALILEKMGHSSSVMTEWWIPKAQHACQQSVQLKVQSLQNCKMHHLSCTISVTWPGEPSQLCLLPLCGVLTLTWSASCRVPKKVRQAHALDNNACFDSSLCKGNAERSEEQRQAYKQMHIFRMFGASKTEPNKQRITDLNLYQVSHTVPCSSGDMHVAYTSLCQHKR